jgi:hypothetical protein
MKRTILLISLFILSGCDLRKREIEMDKKASALRQKEQELNLREQSLQIREARLNEKQKFLDSTSRVMNDSITRKYQYIPGTWLVEMECTETNCPGSAVGDVSNEQWEFTFQDNHVIVSATRNNNLVRVYTGDFNEGSLQLAEPADSSAARGNMLVRLQPKNAKEMQGRREITREDGCRILYALRLKKKR